MTAPSPILLMGGPHVNAHKCAFKYYSRVVFPSGVVERESKLCGIFVNQEELVVLQK